METLSEADTKAKLTCLRRQVDPVLHRIGWTEDLIHREETACGIDIIEGKPKRRECGRIDYLLRIRVNISSQHIEMLYPGSPNKKNEGIKDV